LYVGGVRTKKKNASRVGTAWQTFIARGSIAPVVAVFALLVCGQAAANGLRSAPSAPSPGIRAVGIAVPAGIAGRAGIHVPQGIGGRTSASQSFGGGDASPAYSSNGSSNRGTGKGFGAGKKHFSAHKKGIAHKAWKKSWGKNGSAGGDVAKSDSVNSNSWQSRSGGTSESAAVSSDNRSGGQSGNGKWGKDGKSSSKYSSKYSKDGNEYGGKHFGKDGKHAGKHRDKFAKHPRKLGGEQSGSDGEPGLRDQNQLGGTQAGLRDEMAGKGSKDFVKKFWMYRWKHRHHGKGESEGGSGQDGTNGGGEPSEEPSGNGSSTPPNGSSGEPRPPGVIVLTGIPHIVEQTDITGSIGNGSPPGGTGTPSVFLTLPGGTGEFPTGGFTGSPGSQPQNGTGPPAGGEPPGGGSPGPGTQTGAPPGGGPPRSGTQIGLASPGPGGAGGASGGLPPGGGVSPGGGPPPGGGLPPGMQIPASLLGIDGSNPNAVAPPPRRRANPPASGEPRLLPDEILVELLSNVSENTLNQIAQRYGLVRIGSLNVQLLGATLHRLRVTGGRSVAEVIRALGRERVLRSIQANNLYLAGTAASDDDRHHAEIADGGAKQKLAQRQDAQTQRQELPRTAEPSEPPAAVIELGKRAAETSIPQDAPPEGVEAQYALAKLRLPEAHLLAKGDNILIAVIDSGIDEAHPDLADIIAGKFDAVGGVDKPHSHGTAVAGAIVSHGKLRGAAPSARLLAVRAFEPADVGAVGTTFNIVKGLDWAATQGARVVNMSFAGPPDPLLERAFIAVRRRGIVLIAAAGNGGPKASPQYPAADRNVLAVTATDVDDRLFPAANRGSYVAIAAPGVDVLLPAPDARYQISSGTSIAAAHVTGIVALLVERRRSLNPTSIERILLRTARDLGAKGRDDEFGAGLSDAYSALINIEPRTAAPTSRPAPR
jgi:hypothetical protein